MSTALERSQPVPRSPANEGRLVVDGVSWEQYESLLELFDDRRLRITYDRGTLELMSPSPRHEWYKEVVANLVRSLADGLEIDYVSFGSMRFKHQPLERGVEPDACFIIGSYRSGRRWTNYDPTVDPPPDLVVEIDLTSDSRTRLAAYAVLGVPEIWRFDGGELVVLTLQEGVHVPAAESPSFPLVPLDALSGFIRGFEEGSERVWMESVRRWARSIKAREARPDPR